MLTIDNAATTLDNTDVTKTFLYSTKQFFDIGLSAGIRIDPIFRLDNTGDVYFNTGFGTGTYNGVKVFDNEFKEFELHSFELVLITTLQKEPLIPTIASFTILQLKQQRLLLLLTMFQAIKNLLSSVFLMMHADVFYTEYAISQLVQIN